MRQHFAASSSDTSLSPGVDRFHVLLEHSPDAIAEFDGALRYISANTAWANLLGLPLRELIDATNDELARQFSHISRCINLANDLHKAMMQVLETGNALRIIHTADTHSVEVVYTVACAGKADCRIFAVGRSLQHGPHSYPSPPGDTSHLAGYASVSTVPAAVNSLPTVSDPDETAPVIIGVEMPGMEDASIEDALGTETPIAAGEDESSTASVYNHQATVGEKHQAEQIRSSADFLRLVLDSIPQYIFWKDRNSVYLGCNRRWAEMSGIGEPDNVVGITDADLPWTEEQKAWYIKCDRQVMETGTPMLGIKQSQRQADGQLTWRETNKIPIRDAHGKIVGLLGTIEDVTERKQAEDLLKQSKETYKKLAKREELLNHLSSQIRNSLDLETILKTVVREVRHLLDTDRVVIYEFDADWHGTVIVEDVVPPWVSTLGEMGADDCFPAMFAELYEDGRVRAIADIHNAGLDDCHRDFLAKLQVKANLIVPIQMNQRLWGLLIAHSCRATREWQETEIDLLRYLAEQVSVAIRQGQLYAQAKDSALKSRAQAEQIETALQELQQAQTQLIQTEKMSSLGQLVAGVAHEINNPVNFIYGNIAHIGNYTEELLELITRYQEHYPNPPADIQRALEEIDLDFLVNDTSKILQSLRIGAERIRSIVLSLRNFSRLDEAEMKPVDLHEGIDSTLLILQHRLKPSPVKDEIQLVKNYGTLPQVECYPSQLNQVFMNILSNAIDALEDWQATVEGSASGNPDPMTITITTTHVGDRHRAQVRIHNNGSYIEESVYKQLFDPFFTTKPIGQGTGLGLSISQQIVVQKHRGCLTCHSAPGEGVEFCIEIPITQS